MATLVQFLASGVNGAANGSATFLLRGTASSALSVMYNEFEALTQPASNVVELDANGAAEVYVDAYVDVELKNSAGVTLRTVTVGNSAPLVEVQSTSFTGTDYDGNPANTAGEPITLKAVLDKWIQSAGTTDWRVLIGGIATDLDSAFAGVSGLIINVKDPAYGAVGDGVTDDTTAIVAAQAAAQSLGIGIVFFPPGGYRISTITLNDTNANWVGCGANSSVIIGDTSTSMIVVTSSTAGPRVKFSGLSFVADGPYTRIFALSESQVVSFDHCSFDGTNCTESCIRGDAGAEFASYMITNCDFTVGTSNFAVRNGASGGNRQLFIDSCTFTVPAGFTGDILAGADMNVTGCVFDGSFVVAGTYYHVDAEGSSGEYKGSFVGNTFYDGGSDGFAFKLTGLGTDCAFTEDANVFYGFVAPSATGEKGHTYDITDAESGAPGTVRLGSRKGRIVRIVNSADDAFTVSACLEAEHVHISQTNANPGVVYTIPALLPGLSGRVVVANNSGSGDNAVSCVDSTAVGAFVNIDSNEEALGTNFGGSGEVCSWGYVTTVLASGVFRSLITSEINHHS